MRKHIITLISRGAQAAGLSLTVKHTLPDGQRGLDKTVSIPVGGHALMKLNRTGAAFFTVLYKGSREGIIVRESLTKEALFFDNLPAGDVIELEAGATDDETKEGR